MGPLFLWGNLRMRLDFVIEFFDGFAYDFVDVLVGVGPFVEVEQCYM